MQAERREPAEYHVRTLNAPAIRRSAAAPMLTESFGAPNMVKAESIEDDLLHAPTRQPRDQTRSRMQDSGRNEQLVARPPLEPRSARPLDDPVDTMLQLQRRIEQLEGVLKRPNITDHDRRLVADDRSSCQRKLDALLQRGSLRQQQKETHHQQKIEIRERFENRQQPLQPQSIQSTLFTSASPSIAVGHRQHHPVQAHRPPSTPTSSAIPYASVNGASLPDALLPWANLLERGGFLTSRSLLKEERVEGYVARLLQVRMAVWQ